MPNSTDINGRQLCSHQFGSKQQQAGCKILENIIEKEPLMLMEETLYVSICTMHLNMADHAHLTSKGVAKSTQEHITTGSPDLATQLPIPEVPTRHDHMYSFFVLRLLCNVLFKLYRFLTPNTKYIIVIIK